MSTNAHQSNLRKTIPENQQHAKAHSHLFISGLDPKSVNVETIVVKNVLYCETIFKFVLKKKAKQFGSRLIFSGVLYVLLEIYEKIGMFTPFGNNN